MRLGVFLQRHRAVVVGLATMLCALFLGYEAHSRWVMVEGAVPSERGATLIRELYQVFDTSDMPGGVIMGLP